MCVVAHAARAVLAELINAGCPGELHPLLGPVERVVGFTLKTEGRPCRCDSVMDPEKGEMDLNCSWAEYSSGGSEKVTEHVMTEARRRQSVAVVCELRNVGIL